MAENVDDKLLEDMIFAASLKEPNKVFKEDFMRVMRKMKLFW